MEDFTVLFPDPVQQGLPEIKARLQELSERTGIESSELIYATGRGHGATREQRDFVR
ncbi:hypothetical protein [Anabaena lutea]|uniref:hypothetical protein n=1 Tax=Anabaena lutea TaxID=212350 RepID=UPI001682EFAF|nr:hypothetical protein [Anabaena lutea]